MKSEGRRLPAPPGPSQLQNLLLAPQLVLDPRRPIEAMTRKYGPVWRSQMPDRHGLVPMVWLMGRDGNERILAPQHRSDFTWYEGYRFTMEPLFGRDILFLLDDEPEAEGGDKMRREGAHHERHRLLVPAFHPRLDEKYLPDMGAIIDRHLGRLPVGTPVDMQWEIKRITFHIVAQLLFGAAETELRHLMHLFEEIGLGLFSLVHLRVRGLPFHRACQARAELARYIRGRIDSYRRGPDEPPTMLAQLMREQSAAGDRLPDETLVAEMIAFLFAGYDTTSSMLTSLLVALGDNAAAYARLRDELRDGDAPARGALDEKAIERPFLDAVLLETERLYPPLVFAMRGVRRDFSFGGYHIARGSKVAYSPYYTGRQPSLFPEPLRFAPERFLDEGTIKKPQPYTLLGFGGGHRLCIGKRFALLEMRLLVTMLLQRFDLEPLPGPSGGVYFNPTLQRKNGYRVVLHRRKVRALAAAPTERVG